MKPIFPKTLLSISSSSSPSSSYRIFIAQFSNYSSFSPRRHEEESRNVRVSVWWDFENCHVPAGLNVFKVAHTITAAIRANGMKGPVTITAFGDVVQMSRANQEALSSTGINIAHVPNGGKNSADRSLLIDLMYWVSQNPPPAHLFLISGDRDFASILHRLRMNNYNILLASRESAPNVLCSAASIMWNWESLVRGENLAGKYFNQPPDGPYGSWYGHYKGPLLDPFAVSEQPANSPASSCTDETLELASETKLHPLSKQGIRQISGLNKGSIVDPVAVTEQPANSPASSCTDETTEPASDSKFHPVPKPVIRQIRHILNSYPKGIPITELRMELSKSPVTIDKDLYGYKKFSRFLLSMPNILKLQSEGDGHFLVCGITPKAPEPFETSLGPSNGHFCKNRDQELSKSLKLNGDMKLKNGAAKGKSVLPSSPDVVKDQSAEKIQQIPLSSEKVVDKKVMEPLEKVQQTPLNDQNVIAPDGVQEFDGHLQQALKQDFESEIAAFFKKFWLRWFGGTEGESEIKSQHIPEKFSDSVDIPKKISQDPPNKLLTCDDGRKQKLEEKYMKSPTQDGEMAESVQEKKIATSAKACGDKSTTSPGVLNRIVNWCKFWKSRPNSDALVDHSSEGLKWINSNDQKHAIFLKESFWSDMESFLDSPRGSVIVSRSRTRKQMAQSLKEEIPLVLRDLSDCNLLDLVDLLIFEKKWVEEHPSEKSPFRISGLLRKKSSLDHSHAANGLSSISSNTPSQSDRLIVQQREDEKKSLNSLPHAGVSDSAINKQSSLDQSHAANGLSSIFLNTQSHSVPLKVQKHEEEKKSPNIPHAGVSGSTINKLPSDRSLDDIIADYQKLVDELLKEYPEGYNLISFRKLFKERYGYHLDLQKLGYRKLSTLLQIMPGVKIESNYIFPASEVLDTSKKDDDSDSQWEELGPVSNLGFDGKEVQSRQMGGLRKEMKRQTYPDYEPSVSDDEFSDSEGDTSTTAHPGLHGKPEVNDEDSSLLQILDSWNSSKEEGNNKKNKSDNVVGIVDRSTETMSETCSGNSVQKQRPQKNYCFVSGAIDNEKDKLIDGILGSLKKSGESRIQRIKNL